MGGVRTVQVGEVVVLVAVAPVGAPLVQGVGVEAGPRVCAVAPDATVTVAIGVNGAGTCVPSGNGSGEGGVGVRLEVPSFGE